MFPFNVVTVFCFCYCALNFNHIKAHYGNSVGHITCINKTVLLLIIFKNPINQIFESNARFRSKLLKIVTIKKAFNEEANRTMVVFEKISSKLIYNQMERHLIW